MKTIRLFSLFACLVTLSAQAQIFQVTITCVGRINDTLSRSPVPGQRVWLNTCQDSLYTYPVLKDSALTDDYGYYFVSVTTPWVPGTPLPFEVSTLDCQQTKHKKLNYYTGRGNVFGAYFSLCTDYNPGTSCANQIYYISPNGLYADFAGRMKTPQPATYTWDFGDGTGASGQNVNHTYQGTGEYLVRLSTTTPGGCSYMSQQMFNLSAQRTHCHHTISCNPQYDPLSISFIGYASYPSQYFWSFGDESPGVTYSSLEEYPIHTYQVRGIYQVSLTTINKDGCSFQSKLPVFVDTLVPIDSMTMSGFVFAGSDEILSEGRVELSYNDPEFGMTVQSQSPVDATGFQLDNINEGYYYLEAFPEPGSVAASQYLPTFYGDVALWDKASGIYLGYPVNPYDIHLVPLGDMAVGGDTISGQVSSEGKKTVMAGLEIILFNADGQPVAYCYTDDQGQYLFANLPAGNYTIHPNIMGIYATPAQASLTESSPSAIIDLKISGNSISGNQEFSTSSELIKTYPCPAERELYIEFRDSRQHELSIEILDLAGICRYRNQLMEITSKQKIRLDISQLYAGLYLLHITDNEGNSWNRKFLKK